MRVFRRVLPHLTISLSLALIVVTIADTFNPAMAFLSSTPGRTLIYITVAAALLTSVFSVAAELSDRARQGAASDEKQEQPRQDGLDNEQGEDMDELFIGRGKGYTTRR